MIPVEGTAPAGAPEEGTQTGSGQPEGNQEPEPQAQNGESGVAGEAEPTPKWIEQVSKDLKNDPNVYEELKKHPTITDYVKAQQEKTQQGKESGSGEPAGGEKQPSNYDDFTKTLAEEYDPYGLLSGTLKEQLAQAGVPKDKAEAVYDTLNTASEETLRQMLDKGGKRCEEVLKERWGDQYEEKKAAMTRAYKALAVEPGSDLGRGLDRTGASINPYVAEVFSAIGENIKEDGTIHSSKTGGGKPAGAIPIDYSKSTS